MRNIEQIQSFSDQEKSLLMQCRAAVKALDPDAQIILYGSRARGDAGPESDYDLLVLSEKESTLEREDMFRRRLFPVELETGAVLTIMLLSRKAWSTPLYDAMPFYKNVKNEGVIL